MSFRPRPLLPEKEAWAVRPGALAAALVLMGLLLLVVAWRMGPPAAKGVDAPADQFSAGRAGALLQQLLAEEVPHPVGSEANDRVRERIVAGLEGLGYEVNLQETVACRSDSGAAATCAPVVNILSRLPGREAGPAVMLATHYDSVWAGPGASDDGSGVVMILEIARILKAEGPFRNPILFLITDAEEIGLVGAQGFVDEHPWAQEVGVAVNLEARGSGGLGLMFETSEDNAWLIDAYARAVPRPATSSLSYEVYKIMPNDTDLTVLREAGMAGLNLAYIGDGAHYHTSLDNLAHVDLGSIQHQGESALAVLRELAQRDLTQPPRGAAAYMDLLGLGVIRWLAGWTLPLAAGTLALWLVVAVVLLLRRGMTVGGMLLGLLAGLLAVVLPILLGLGLTWFIARLSWAPSPWTGYPIATRAALWAGALWCGCLVAAAFARRAGLWGMLMGVWLVWSILALVLSFTLPGAANLFVGPTYVALLLAGIVAFTPLLHSAPARETAAILAVPFAAALWLPLALLFEYAVGFELSPAVTLPVGLVVSAFVPLLALPRGRTGLRRWLLLGATLAVAAATTAAVLLPPYTATYAQPLSLQYVEDSDHGEAHWATAPPRTAIPEPLRSEFDEQPLAVYPWYGGEAVVAAAAPSGAPPPDLTVLSQAATADGRVVEAELRSPRGGREIGLLLPVDRLRSLALAGRQLPVRAADSGGGNYVLWCYGRTCDGLTVRLELTGAEPLEVIVVDQSSGLPIEGERFLEARPDTAVPQREGDTTILFQWVEL